MKGIDQADFAIMIFSKSFGKSKWTKKEQNDFIAKQKATKCKILPILYEIRPDEVDSNFIKRIQAVFSKDNCPKDITIKLAKILLKSARAK